MSKRKHVHHGSKRKVAKSISPATGTQSANASGADLIKITTAGGSTTALTLNITDVYEGQEVYIDFNSQIAGDTLVVTLNGTASSVDVVTAITANQRSLSRVVVLDAASGAEKGSQSLDNADIT
jgi:FKBP-type peptidyl-prolyl cis-trans isomerase 2